MNNSSIGIIGGADGPTAIFITTSHPLWLTLICIAAAAAIAFLIARWAVRHIKRK